MRDVSILIKYKVSHYYALFFHFRIWMACNLLTTKPVYIPSSPLLSPPLLLRGPPSLCGTASKGIFKALYQTKPELRGCFHSNSPACRFTFLKAAVDECTHFKWRHRNWIIYSEEAFFWDNHGQPTHNYKSSHLSCRILLDRAGLLTLPRKKKKACSLLLHFWNVQVPAWL